MDGMMRTLLTLSLSGGALALLWFAVKPLVRAKLPKSFQYYILLLMLLRMVLPLPGLRPAETPTAPKPRPTESTVYVEGGQEEITAVTGNPAQEVALEVPRPEGVPEQADPPAQAARSTDLSEIRPFLMKMLMPLWVIGAAMSLLYRLGCYARFMINLTRRAKSISNDQARVLTEMKRAMGVTNHVSMLASPLASVPMLVGIVKPRIILPDADLMEEQLENILLHELTHLRRKDIWIKWFATIVLSLHWFNPIVYFIQRELNRACELSCDEAVIKHLDTLGKQRYGDALIDMAKAGVRTYGVISTAMSAKHSTLRERLVYIMEYRKPTKKIVALSLCLLLFFLSCAGMLGVAAQAPAKEGVPSTLTLVMPRDWTNSETDRVAEAKFRKMHPDVDLTIRDYPSNDLTVALTVNDPGLDLLVVGAGAFIRTELTPLYQGGFLTNLLEHPGIADNLEKWIDLSKVFGYEGGLYAIPMYQKFYCNTFQLNRSVADRLKIDPPVRGWTFEDVYALYDLVKDYNETADQPVLFMKDQAYMPLMSRHLMKNNIDPINGTAAIDTPEFARFLTWWKAGINDGLIDHWKSGGSPIEGIGALFELSESLYSSARDRLWVYPPVIEESDRYPVRPLAYAVNHNSAMKDYALDYLYCLTSEEAQYAEPILTSQPLLKDMSGYAMITPMPKPETIMDNTKLFVDLIENGVDDSCYRFELDFGDLIIDYVAGKIELDEMLSITQTKADIELKR